MLIGSQGPPWWIFFQKNFKNVLVYPQLTQKYVLWHSKLEKSILGRRELILLHEYLSIEKDDINSSNNALTRGWSWTGSDNILLGRGHKRKHLDSFNVLDIFIVRNYQTGHKVDLSLSLTFPSHKQVTKSDFRQFVNNTKDIWYTLGSRTRPKWASWRMKGSRFDSLFRFSIPDISSRRAGPPRWPRPRPPRGGSSTSCGWWRTARAGWPPEPGTVIRYGKW